MRNLLFLAGALCLASCGSKPKSEPSLADSILQDQNMEYVDSLARETIRHGFNAGHGYSQIWARDMNTFVELALDVTPQDEIRNALLIFFQMQQPNGEMVDGYVVHKDFTWNDDTPYYSKAAPDHVGFKNTVETDQETSLIQMVGKYVAKTGDTSILKEEIDGRTVEQRMEDMIDYLMAERYNKEYKLLWGAMTADWGDVQPHDTFGCDWNELSNEAIDVYDNAMMVIALDYLEQMSEDAAKKAKWAQMKNDFKENTRKHLWDVDKQKFKAHIYPDESPIPDSFNEDEVFYHGGTALAIEANILTKEEIKAVYDQMVKNVEQSGMPSIGLTMYPPYPEGFFKGWMEKPYAYQNGGDWTWFGARIIQQLIRNGFVEEAYVQVQPMLDRVVANNDFFEWYAMGNIPSGSANFKASAGVLAKSIEMFRAWANENPTNK